MTSTWGTAIGRKPTTCDIGCTRRDVPRTSSRSAFNRSASNARFTPARMGSPKKVTSGFSTPSYARSPLVVAVQALFLRPLRRALSEDDDEDDDDDDDDDDDESEGSGQQCEQVATRPASTAARMLSSAGKDLPQDRHVAVERLPWA